MKTARAKLLAALTGVLLAGWVLIIGLPPSLVLSREDRAHYQTLRQAQHFASRAVGYAAVEPPEARAFVALARSRQGGTAFKYLLLQGSMAAKVYALVGLRRTNPIFFRFAVQPFRVWPGYVPTFFGCIISAERVNTIIESHEANAIRLPPNQTLVDWYRSRPGSRAGTLDVVGGGYTSMFLEWEELTRPEA